MESSMTPSQADADQPSTTSDPNRQRISMCDLQAILQHRQLDEDSKPAIQSLLALSYDVIKTHSLPTPNCQQTPAVVTSPRKYVPEQPRRPVKATPMGRESNVHPGIVSNPPFSHSASSATERCPKVLHSSSDLSALATTSVNGEGSTLLDPQGTVEVSDSSHSKLNTSVSREIKREQSPSRSLGSEKEQVVCSFTDSDDNTDDDDGEDPKDDNDDYFQVMYDIDEASMKSSSGTDSESGTFLTCSVCGKELPETAEPEGGKEVCNTCKLVRMESQVIKAKPNPKRKKKATEPCRETEALVPPIKRYFIDKDTVESLVPLRKSSRKRVSTISIKDLAQAYDDAEADLLPVDDDTDADFVDTTSSKRKVKPVENASRKVKAVDESTKSVYAQQLDLTPVFKTDPERTEEDVSAEITQDNTKVDVVTEVTEVKRKKKGRPKGSKNKSQGAKEIKTLKESKRDMSFNKRWHRTHGPVPDANPDAIDGLWSCEFCMKTFSLRRNFLAHRRKHSGRHACTDCGETFECNSKLQRHIRRHRGEKPFACHLCPKAYAENMWLQRHLAVHLAEGHSPLPKPYQCNICGRQYTHKGTMIYHVKTHTETKFYQCDVCGKQFTHRSSLECHIKTHTGEKPFVCEICGKRFADRSVQLRHTRSHSGDKPYKCTICDKGFTQSGTLNIHMRLHTSEKPYKCKLCDAGFLKRSELTKHSKTHLGELLSNNINLITCRVTENKGDDIQKKAAQILINAYGERRPDGSIEIKTRQCENPNDSYLASQFSGIPGQAGNYPRQSEDPTVDSQDILIKLDAQSAIHLTHEEIQRRALEFIAMKQQELELMTMSNMSTVPLPVDRYAAQPCPEQVVEQQAVEVATEHEHMDANTVAQQIERHVEEHAVERQLLEQVEGQVVRHDYLQSVGHDYAQVVRRVEGQVVGQVQVEGQVVQKVEGQVLQPEHLQREWQTARHVEGQVGVQVVGREQVGGQVVQKVEGQVLPREHLQREWQTARQVQVEGQVVGREQVGGQVVQNVEGQILQPEHLQREWQTARQVQVEKQVFQQEQVLGQGQVARQVQVERQVFQQVQAVGQEQEKVVRQEQGQTVKQVHEGSHVFEQEKVVGQKQEMAMEQGQADRQVERQVFQQEQVLRQEQRPIVEQGPPVEPAHISACK